MHSRKSIAGAISINFCSNINHDIIKLNSTIDKVEIEKFNKHAKLWWDPNGTLRILMEFNSVRIPLITNGLIATGRITADDIKKSDVLKGVNILEVGCGGGLQTEVIIYIFLLL